MSKSKQSIVCLVILLAMPLMALAQRGGKSAAPTVSSISPASATAGGTGFTLTVAGSNFTLASVVQWNGASLTTTYVSATQLQASIPSALVSVAGTAQITVFTSGRGGGTSNGVGFTINPAATTTTTTTATMLAITTTSVSAGTVGTSYSATLAASGGTSPYTWSISSGALPPGLALSAAGAISGTPTTSGTYSFTPQVADSASHTATNTYSMVVSTGPLTIATTSVPAGTAGTAYSTAMAASGGTPPHGWSVSGGALPPGLSMSSSGAISGTPATGGSYSFTARVADAASGTASYTYGLSVAAPTTTTPAAGPVFQDGFESGGFSAWSSLLSTSTVTINSDPRLVRSGAYSAQIHYVLCGDSTNTACGASHQDANRYVEKDFNSRNGFPNGLDHFFLRGYVYLKSPEAGGSKDIQRKLFYLMSPATASHPVYDWAALVDTFATSSTGYLPQVTFTLVNDVAGVPALQYYSRTLLNYDQWYSVEIEVQANTPDVADGAARIWINGTMVIEKTGLVFRSNGYSMGITRMLIGDQADRTNYLPVDEYRYWDDIVVSLTGPIGP